jgi:hypothetical protein
MLIIPSMTPIENLSQEEERKILDHHFNERPLHYPNPLGVRIKSEYTQEARRTDYTRSPEFSEIRGALNVVIQGGNS